MRPTSVIILLSIASVVGAQNISFRNGYAMVFPKNGDGFVADDIHLEADSIVILAPELQVFAKQDISKIIARRLPSDTKGIGIGSLVGLYGMHFLLGRAENQPSAFLDNGMYTSSDYLGGMWVSLLGVVVGGGIGALADANPIDRSNLAYYIFSGDAAKDNEQWMRFLQDSEENSARPRWHITVSGGSVTTPTANGYRNVLANAGYEFPEYYYYYENFLNTSYTKPSTKFNILRRASVEYSFTDNIAGGLTIAWQGEPVMFARKDNNGSNSSSVVMLRLDGKGYYATGSYHYYFGKKKEIDLSLLAGAGMSDMRFELQGATRSSQGIDTTFNFNERKNYLSFMLTGNVGYYLYRNLSLSLNANYFYGGSLDVPGIPFLQVPSMNASFGTADIGFTLGLHF